MKRKLPIIFIFVLIAATANAQFADSIYWAEGFEGGTISTVSPTSGGPIGYYAEGASSPGSWYVSGVYRTTGTACAAPYGAYHLRFRNGAVSLPDSPYVVTPLVNKGIRSIHLTHTRADKNITIFWTADTLATTTNWNLVGVFERYQATCTDLYMPVNQTSARRLKIVGRQSTDSDEDSIWLTSVVPLPVKFTSITASYVSGAVKVNWQTSTESGIAFYEIERSFNGREFFPVGKASAKENNNSLVNYAWVDATPLNGISYYRVKALEKDGQASYTTIVRVNTSRDKAEIAVAPNPVKSGQLNVQLSSLTKGTYSLKLYNNVGQMVYSSQVSTEGGSLNQSFSLPSTVKPGVYNLQVTGGDIQLNKRVMVE
jgi:hypothetical protein